MQPPTSPPPAQLPPPAGPAILQLPAAATRGSDAMVLAGNVTLFLLAGTVLGVWFWRNSDWFEEFGAVLTFSGALSWLAMALKLVPESKLAKLQEVFFERAFERRRMLPVHAAILGLVGVATCGFATVQIEPLQESVERPVVVERYAGDAPPAGYWERHIAGEEFEVLRPGERLRVVVPVWGSWRAPVVVAVAGFPEKSITLHPWQRRDLLVPSSFRRPVVLLRATSELMAEAELAPRTLVVTRRRAGQPPLTREMPFDGHAVWVGCDAHVEVPAFWRESWAQEAGWAQHATKWLFPKSLRLPGDLVAQDTLEIEVRGPAGVDWKLVEPHVVRAPSARADFLPDIIKIGKDL